MDTPSPPASPGPEAYNDDEHSREGEYNSEHADGYARHGESDLRSPPASPGLENDEQEPEESDVFRSPPASPVPEAEDDEEHGEGVRNDGEKDEAAEEGPRKVGKLISNIFGDESDGEGEQEPQNEGYDSNIRAELQESEEDEKEWDFDRIIESKKKERGKKKRKRHDGSIDLCSNADGQIRHVVELMKDAAAADREANNQRRPAVQKTKMLEVVRSVLLRADFFEALLENDMMSAISEWLAPLPDKSLPALEIRQVLSNLLKILESFPNLEPGILKQSGLGKAVMLIFKHPKETRENKIIASKLIRNWSQPIFQISADYSSMSRDERERLDLDHLPDVKRRRIEDRLSQGSSSSHRTMKPEERLLGPGDKGFINRARVPQKSTAAYIIRPKPKVEYSAPFRGSTKNTSNSRFDKAAREFKERTKGSKSQRAMGVKNLEERKSEDEEKLEASTMDAELMVLEPLKEDKSCDNDSYSISTTGIEIKRTPSPEVNSQKDFYAYQTSLFFFTQLGYLPIAGSMLSTTFFEPTQTQCGNQSNPDFNSLLIAWDQHCRQSSLTTVISSMVMLGGVVGAFLSGFLADTFGRKPVIVGCMVVISVFNCIVAGIGDIFPLFSSFLFCILGAACGGYMVTNLVLVVENLGQPSSRLLVVSLNGWPLGMCFTSLIGYVSKDWRVYHIIISTTAAILCGFLQCISLESVRWLKHRNHLGRADKVQLKIDGRNVKINGLLPRGLQSQDIEKKLPSMDESSSQVGNVTKKYTYLDLFRYESVRTPLMALVYCFAASSIVSFGFYFSVEVLPGNRYVNLASMGALKFTLGFIPFAVSFCMGRRPIIIISVAVAGISAWSYIILSLALKMSDNVVITVLGLLVTASMDPTWKIIHLYSAELFPTVVRNMARGICNVGARMGSLAAPMIVYSRIWFDQAPIIVFAILLTIQWIVVFWCFPETKDKPLRDEIEESTKMKSGEQKALKGV
ncbi:hypothetical protein FO519_005579 [Halicephalobus sp. NKZ332]|nr:hypothetical protein FO519_005579 [Halicephalobus sp. NKZ332]